jgi:hypothetical protein
MFSELRAGEDGLAGAYVGRPELPIGNCQTRAAKGQSAVVVQNEELNVHCRFNKFTLPRKKLFYFFT